MTPQTNEELEQVCKEICPSCAKGDPLRYRAETREWTHDLYSKGSFAHSFCLASNYRSKYKDQVSG